MVAKFVTTSLQGDLFNAADFFGAGNDTLFLMIPTPNMAVIRTYQGNDSVMVSGTPSGSLGYKVFLGLGNDTFLGSNKKDIYSDEGGDDQINMSADMDYVYAGPGDDTIDGGAGEDEIYFGSAFDMFGNSTPVTQAVTLNLALTVAQDLGFYGNDTFLNFENVRGGAGDDKFLGTNAVNDLVGEGGADYLRGFGGDDIILGEEGGDTLIGDAGADKLHAGHALNSSTETDGDPDVIRYLRLSDSTVEDADSIFEFENIARGGCDKIDLSDIDANSSLAGNQVFKFIGTAGFSSAIGEVKLVISGDNTLVLVNNDSDTQSEMVIIVKDVTGLTADDFIL